MDKTLETKNPLTENVKKLESDLGGKREFDVIVYGASSYVGKFVLERFKKMDDIKVAIACRDIGKIKKYDFEKIECCIDDIETITKRAKVLINLVGPYSNLCDKIIESCIKTKTHYLDLCEEITCLIKIKTVYNSSAISNNVTVIQACGFESFASDVYSQHFTKSNKEENIMNLRSTFTFNNVHINHGTWDSFLLILRTFKTENHKIKNEKPRLKQRRKFWSPEVKFCCGPDNFIAQKSSEHFKNYTNEVFFNLKYRFQKPFVFLLLWFMLKVIKYDFWFNLFKRFPWIFSIGVTIKKGPSDKQIEKSSFKLNIESEDKKNMVIVGPDAAYVSTAIFVCYSAKTLILNEKLVSKGVVTPAMAFYKTNIVEKISKETEIKIME